MDRSDFSVRAVTEADCMLLHQLAGSCPPLDVHTPYTYWVLCTRFSKTCFVLLHGEEPVGFLTSVKSENELFLWQIGLLPEWRRNGLSQLLIEAAVRTAGPDDLIRVTIAADNQASLSAFRSYCRKHALSFVQEPQFDPALCPDLEDTYRLGKGEPV